MLTDLRFSNFWRTLIIVFHILPTIVQHTGYHTVKTVP